MCLSGLQTKKKKLASLHLYSHLLVIKTTNQAVYVVKKKKEEKIKKKEKKQKKTRKMRNEQRIIDFMLLKIEKKHN